MNFLRNLFPRQQLPIPEVTLSYMLGKRSYPPETLRSKSTQSSNSDQWKIIYKFPLIHWIAALNRLKNYQLGLTTMGFPVAVALQYTGQVSENFIIVFSSMGVTGSLTLGLFSYLSKNLIGIAYLNRNEDKVKLAYIDFWGRRKDIETPLDGILPPSESSALSNKFNLFYQVKIEENPETYKLLHRLGTITDNGHFLKIFG